MTVFLHLVHPFAIMSQIQLFPSDDKSNSSPDPLPQSSGPRTTPSLPGMANEPQASSRGAGLLEQPLSRQDAEAYPRLHRWDIQLPPRLCQQFLLLENG